MCSIHLSVRVPVCLSVYLTGTYRAWRFAGDSKNLTFATNAQMYKVRKLSGQAEKVLGVYHHSQRTEPPQNFKKTL